MSMWLGSCAVKLMDDVMMVLNTPGAVVHAANKAQLYLLLPTSVGKSKVS